MPKNFVQQAFRIWNKQNRNRFNHPPTQIRYIQGEVRFFFTDVIHNISVVMNNCGCNVAFTYQNEVWDLLICFDVTVESDSDGYYCGQCIAREGGKIKGRHLSRMDLLACHVFESLLIWSNEKLNKDTLAQICQTKNGGSSWVNLVLKEQVQRKLINESGFFREIFSSNCKNEVCVMNVIEGRKLRMPKDYYYSIENICSRWLGR